VTNERGLIQVKGAVFGDPGEEKAGSEEQGGRSRPFNSYRRGGEGNQVMARRASGIIIVTPKREKKKKTEEEEIELGGGGQIKKSRRRRENNQLLREWVTKRERKTEWVGGECRRPAVGSQEKGGKKQTQNASKK